MPAYSEERMQYHIERVREVLALNPRMSIRNIREELWKSKKDPLHLDPWYIAKLRKKIDVERTHRFDRAKVEKRIAELADRTEMIIAEMFAILKAPKVGKSAKIAAAKEIIVAEHKLFQAQLDAGIFNRKLGVLEVAAGLSVEQRMLIEQAFNNYGIIEQDGKPTRKLPHGDAR